MSNLIDDKDEREKLAGILGDVINTISARHMNRKTQEPAITAKIGQGLEDAISTSKSILEALQPYQDQIVGSNYDISMTVQDIPDRGANSLEKISGIDLYISVTVKSSGIISSKGIIIQAKKAGSSGGLLEQCEKMKERSHAAYVWIYKVDGTSVLDAQEVIIASGLADPQLGISPDQLFDGILECNKGDVEIGLDPDLDEEVALDEMLQRLRAPRGVSFTLSAEA